MTGESDCARWYAVYCRSRHERQVHERLSLKGIESWVADYETKVRWGKRMRKTRKNLLPGYLLVHVAINPQNYLSVLETKGVVTFIGKRWPDLSVIPDIQVENLQRLLKQGSCPVQPVAYLRPGNWVQVTSGPLQGLLGRVQRLSRNKTNVIVSIDLLQRSVAVEIATEYLQIVEAPQNEIPRYNQQLNKIPV